jgi:hypothetical protein
MVMTLPRRQLSCLVATLLLALAAPAAAETPLPARPSDPVAREEMARLAALAGQIGWGSLFHTEQMAAADSAYGAGPVLAVTAMPYLPVHFWLESRAWAAQRFRPETEADERFMDFVVDPADGLVFDLLVVGQGGVALNAAALRITYVDSAGARLPVLVEAPETADERAMGGSLRTLRARLRVVFSETPDWPAIETFGLEIDAAGTRLAVAWRLPEMD